MFECVRVCLCAALGHRERRSLVAGPPFPAGTEPGWLPFQAGQGPGSTESPPGRHTPPSGQGSASPQPLPAAEPCPGAAAASLVVPGHLCPLPTQGSRDHSALLPPCAPSPRGCGDSEALPGGLPTRPAPRARQGGLVTSLISLILEPPLPIRDPHWLAGTTNLSVTGGLLVAGLLLMELMMSWGGRGTRVLREQTRGPCAHSP